MVQNTLKQFLADRELTVYRLCRETGIPDRTIYAIVKTPSAVPGARILDKICETYNVELWDLLQRVPGE